MTRNRYRHDGVPLLALNALQLRMKRQIDEKVKDGVYLFERVPCCVCQAMDFEPLANKDRYGLYAPVVVCRSCGLIQSSPRMNESAYRTFYNEEYRKLYEGHEGPTDAFFGRQRAAGKGILHFLEESRALPRDLSHCFVLEVGCGAGGILASFKERGCRVKGVDWGEEYVAFGRASHGLDLSVGGLREIARTLDAQPDIVVYSHVFEHVLEPREELQTLHRLCAADGVLYLEMPGVKDLMTRYDRDFLRYLQNAHTYHFSLTTLTNVVHSTGFKLAAGNEYIRSVFVKTPRFDRKITITNDYKDVMAFLKTLEYWRIVHRYSPRRLWRTPRNAVAAFLRRLGAHERLKKPFIRH